MARCAEFCRQPRRSHTQTRHGRAYWSAMSQQRCRRVNTICDPGSCKSARRYSGKAEPVSETVHYQSCHQRSLQGQIMSRVALAWLLLLSFKDNMLQDDVSRET